MRFPGFVPCGTVSVNTFSEGDIKTPFGGINNQDHYQEIRVLRLLIHFFKLKLFGLVILKII